MSIKSDLWIKRMCQEQSLIAPFEESLIRQVGDRRIISRCDPSGTFTVLWWTKRFRR